MSFNPRLRSTWGWLPFLLTVLQPTTASAQPFHVAPIYAADTSIRIERVAADLNGDGRPDLVGTDGSNKLVVLLGDATGGFGPPSFLPAAALIPVEVTIADFNSDSILDLGVADLGIPYPRPEEIEAGILPSGTPGKIVVFLGDGTGSFGPPTTVNEGPNFSWVLSADFNGDGHADLMSSSGHLLVWLGDGAGHFAPPLDLPVATTGEPRVADFNSDGRLDLAYAGSLVQVLLGDGAGGFGPPHPYQTGGYESINLVVGDFNADGKVDLAAPTSIGIYFLPGDGMGGFGMPLQSPGVVAIRAIVGDFNEDGSLDIVGGGGNTGFAAVLGDGAGHFAPGPAYVSGTGTGGYGPVLAADVNGDSHLDLVTSGYGVGVMLGDGAARFDAIQTLATSIDLYPQVAAADFNEDGNLDIVAAGYNDPGMMLLGDGQGGFSNAGSVDAVVGITATEHGDFNGDTHLDLLGVGQDGVCVFLGDGNGSLAHPVITFVISSGHFAVADFNEDGRSDLVVSRTPDDVVSILLSNGQGGFATPVDYFMPTGPDAVAAGDWNGDGHTDLASVGVYSADLSVRLGDGTASFGPRIVIPLVTGAVRMIVGDWNGDGKSDLGLDTGLILLGDGAGGFTPAGSSSAPLVLAGDFDFDGNQDVASLAGTPLEVLLLSPGDGAGGFGAPWSYYAPTGDAGIASGDFNGDGRPDLMLAVDGAVWPFLSLAADLTVSIDDKQAAAVPGSPVSYVATLTNLGPRVVPGATLTPTLPSILLSPTFSPSAGTYDPATGLWTGLHVQAGESVTLTISGTVDASASGSLTVSASIAAPSGYGDPDPANNASSDVDVLAPQADLGVLLQDTGDPARPGSVVTFVATLANTGPSNSPGATSSVTLPGGATFLSSTPGPPACTEAAGVVTCSLPTLVPGQGTTISVSAMLGAPGVATTLASVTGDVPDPQASNDTAAEVTSVLTAPMRELVHGSTTVSALEGGLNPGPPLDAFRVQQSPRSSREIVVDGVTGDIGVGAGPVVEWIDDGALAHPSLPAGAGASRSLRLENATPDVLADGYVRVASAGCSFDCGPEDVYRIRARETTLFGARFNNSASQVTVVVVQNASSDAVHGHVDFWDTTGAWLHGEPFSLQPWQVLLLLPSEIPAIQGQSGSVSVSHDGRLGALGGKATAVEPATGFTFDTPFAPRPD